MLLTLPEVWDTPDDWFAIVKKADSKTCPQCSSTYTSAIDIFCPLDGTELKVSGQDDVLIPVVADRYRLLSYVGRDKIFETYLARDMQSTESNLIVAVNYLHYQLKHDEKTVSRFLTIAKTAIGLDHPNIIGVYEVNVTEDGSPYMVSDFVKGANPLQNELRKRNPIDLVEAMKIFVDIVEALVYAHERGIIHGAISTANLYVRREGEDMPRGLLANFGVAERLLRQLEWDGPSTETRTSNVYGDPSGVCPEFCHGARPFELSDIYQIGCALYEALSAHAPFERDKLTLVLLAHMSDEPDDIRAYVPEIPDGVALILDKCLKKEPGDRYASAAALLDALKAQV
jgi:Serine/threonine protein kinase